ncbi:unnamed protein product [Trichogramma brassicae]|uniref:Uncharacterized protein n=1 Tax=Trichogramma brassicae TaxID=86971 RepID=A0A6H5IP22_9HYME|nr:unnamed protein product [Trichogramma brassicae]
MLMGQERSFQVSMQDLNNPVALWMPTTGVTKLNAKMFSYICEQVNSHSYPYVRDAMAMTTGSRKDGTHQLATFGRIRPWQLEVSREPSDEDGMTTAARCRANVMYSRVLDQFRQAKRTKKIRKCRDDVRVFATYCYSLDAALRRKLHRRRREEVGASVNQTLSSTVGQQVVMCEEIGAHDRLQHVRNDETPKETSTKTQVESQSVKTVRLDCAVVGGVKSKFCRRSTFTQ